MQRMQRNRTDIDAIIAFWPLRRLHGRRETRVYPDIPIQKSGQVNFTRIWTNNDINMVTELIPFLM